jgi:pyruvate-ferredoxin/flavodoxin oxidoreductase
MSTDITIDGNEAATIIAHLCSEVIAIYPITPASPMGELADAWSANQRLNIFGTTPRVIEMQSEAGAAGAIHGSLQGGALTTTFTASQGLLLMLPNMYKIAGELTPAVFHVAARSVASHALSIFCDHSDVMAARGTGFAVVCANNVQEVMDMALIAHAATLNSQVPMVHFFDGFRTSHEIAKITPVTDETVRAMIDQTKVDLHRQRALSPDNPVLRGSAQNPDVFFQSRERITPWYSAMPGIVQDTMDQFAGLTGRSYHLFDYVGADDATKVVVMMGSGAETAHETVLALNEQHHKVGLIKVRLYRPFDSSALLGALPASTSHIAVLDRTKEPGAEGEPLYKDVVTAVAQSYSAGARPTMPHITGGRYGLSSKELTPAMIKGIFDAMSGDIRNSFTVGITDDVSFSHLEVPDFLLDKSKAATSAIFYGLGSDGTVSANKHSITIIGDSTDLYAQGYFEYDSKKAGAITISHLRFGPDPIRAAYLIQPGEADFVGCHQSQFMTRFDLLDRAADNGVFLLNTSVPPEDVWASLPANVRWHIVKKNLTFYIVDAYKVAAEVGMGKRVNTIMQTCFFAISNVLPHDQAIAAIKESVRRTYGKRGRRIIEFNFNAIDQTLAHLFEVRVPDDAAGSRLGQIYELDTESAPAFVQRVTAPMIRGQGNLIPVSELPADGTFPTGTARYEKRNLATEIPVLETDLCTQCGKCVFVCPHSAIRSKLIEPTDMATAPATFKTMPVKSKEYRSDLLMTYQVAPEDCTGCTLCVEACPIRDKSRVNRKALNMQPQPPLRESERVNWEFFDQLPGFDRGHLALSTIPGAMVTQPLFEFSGACAGCGETPYLKLATQLFGDRMLVANATGCSSIYGGNLPTTPWSKNTEGRGPAWSNSLFEDNAEFGLGMRTAVDQQVEYAQTMLRKIDNVLPELKADILGASQHSETEITEQRHRVAKLREQLRDVGSAAAEILYNIADVFVKRSVWIIGGDGWAYDIGFGGVDHVLASGKDVNILVLDTEVYSNTGGQMSKSTPRGAVAKFAAAGKTVPKKNLARIAMDYENVYVAQVAYGARDTQTLHAFLEAESYPGTSIIIAYSPCIAHGIDLEDNLTQQQLAVNSGHWNLLRFDPRKHETGKNPLHLDSRAPSIPYADFAYTESRFKILTSTHPETAERLLHQAQQEVLERHHHYEQLASLSVDEAATPESKQ